LRDRNDYPRAKRIAHPHRAGHRHGRPVPALLDPGADVAGTATAELPAGAGAIARRTLDRIPRHGGTAWADRRILRSSRRFALVRPQRGEWVALPVPRLEI